MRKAIITYCDKNYEWELYNDFIPSLFDVGFKGKLYVIDYGLINQKKIDNVEYIKSEPNMSVEQQRNRDIVNLLLNIKEDVIMTIDAGDVWFQENFDEVFEICKDKLGYVEELYDMHPDGHRWFMQKLLSMKDKKYYELLKDYKDMAGSGMLCGNRIEMAKFLNDVYGETALCDEDFFGVDQIMFNYMLRQYKGKKISLPQTYDYVLITHQKEADYIDGKVYDKNGKLVKIAHNAGGNYRLINRKENLGGNDNDI